MEPSWHTTVVPEFPDGTTTVVFFAGGEGLLLLMQPESTVAATITHEITFMQSS